MNMLITKKVRKKEGIYGNSYLKFSEDRGKIRSKTFIGIAKAMAKQWTTDVKMNQKCV
jgi:hypothetical protein